MVFEKNKELPLAIEQIPEHQSDLFLINPGEETQLSHFLKYQGSGVVYYGIQLIGNRKNARWINENYEYLK